MTLFKGQLSHENQVHDFHPPVGFCGLYWVIPMPEGGLKFSDGGKTAVLDLKGVSVIDQPTWPKFQARATPARMSIKIVWKATGEKVSYNDPQKQFRVYGHKAVAQMEAAVEVPQTGFSWKSDPLETSRAKFAIIGEEANGKYYTP